MWTKIYHFLFDEFSKEEIIIIVVVCLINWLYADYCQEGDPDEFNEYFDPLKIFREWNKKSLIKKILACLLAIPISPMLLLCVIDSIYTYFFGDYYSSVVDFAMPKTDELMKYLQEHHIKFKEREDHITFPNEFTMHKVQKYLDEQKKVNC